MLTQDILNALKSYTADMQNVVTLVLQRGEHESRAGLLEFLSSFASVSDNIIVEEREAGLRSPISFSVEVGAKATGIVFSGIPGGHEFNSLVLAVLQTSGSAIKLDDSIKDIVRSVQAPLAFEVFISLSCHNCPDVVQALNQFALLNPDISCEMIDGGLFKDVVEARNIQGVPSVYCNGEVFANGKIDTAKLIEKLLQVAPRKSVASEENKLPLQDVLVIGGGPAGIASAIYAARKGLAVTVVADRIGGQVKDTLGIENLISVTQTTGPELSNNLLAHMQEYDITLKEHLKVDNIERGKIKCVQLSSGEIIEAKTLIIATGAKWRELGVPGEKENVGNGVAYCPHCDGPFFKGKDVAVVGGGNSGVEAALDLSGIVKSVTVFEFSSELKADKVIVDQAKARENIKILTNVATKQILAENGKVVGIEYQNHDSDTLQQEALSGVFVQIGLVPNSRFLQGTVDLSPYGEVLINEKGETSEPGIFACGDVTTVPYKQIVIAMGEGAKASLSAFDYLIREF